MKVAFLVVCWFSLKQAIFGIEGPWSECELKCEFKCPEGDGWLYPSMVLSGGTFWTIPGISTARMCQSLCAAIPDCEFFTQDEADNTCELKNRNTGEMLSEQKDGAFSGVKCTEDSPIQYETDYAGADFGEAIFAVDNEFECQRICKSNAFQYYYCYYWTFDKGTQRCYLKKNYGWTIRKNEVGISGTRF